MTSKIYIWGTLQDNLDTTEDSMYDTNNSHQKQSGVNELLSKQSFQSQLVKKIENEGIQQISCGKNHASFVTDKGDLYVMGSNDGGQLGIGEYSGPKFFYTPIHLTLFNYKSLKVDQVACGHSHTLALTSTGQVYSWGYGKFGALGLSHFDSRNSPTLVTNFQDYQSSAQVKQIACGAHHSVLLETSGRLYVWGAGEVGQLGLNQRMNECSPKLIAGVNRQQFDVQMVACGYFHTVIQTRNGIVYQTGQFKNGNSSEYSITTAFKEVEGLYNSQIVSLKAKDYTAALNGDGQLIFWFSPKQVQLVHSPLLVNDFELCKQFILARKGVIFYKCYLDSKIVEELNFVQEFEKRDLSMVACGHNYVFAVRTKRGHHLRDKGSKRLQKDRSVEMVKNENSQTQSTSLRIKNHRRHNPNDKEGSNFMSRTMSRDFLSKSKSYRNQTQDCVAQGEFGGTFSVQKEARMNRKDSHSQHRLLNIDSVEYIREKSASKPQREVSFIATQDIKEYQVSPVRIDNEETFIHKSIDKSLRMSMEECQHLQKNLQSAIKQTEMDKIEVQHTATLLQSQLQQTNLQNMKQNEQLRNALTNEIERRQDLEIQIQHMQREFDQFRKEVGIEQMKSVLAESQNEYQKLYEICVQECEKSSKMNDLYKKEKKQNLEHEQKLYNLGEEVQLLQNQIKYLEQQLQREREDSQRKSQSTSIKEDEVKRLQRLVRNLEEQLEHERQEKNQKELKASNLGEETELLRSKIKYLEEQLENERNDKHKYMQQLNKNEQSLQDNERALVELKGELQKEKQLAIEKKFDYEELISQLKEDTANLTNKISDLEEELEKQRAKEEENLEIQMHEMKIKVQQKEQEIDLYKTTAYKIDELNKEIEDQIKQNEALRDKIRQKNSNLKECDLIISQMKVNEGQLKIQIEKLELQQKAKNHVAQKARDNIQNRKPATQNPLNLSTDRKSQERKSLERKSKERSQEQADKKGEFQRLCCLGKPISKIPPAVSPQKKYRSSASREKSPERLQNLIDQQEMQNDLFLKELNQVAGMRINQRVRGESKEKEETQSPMKERPRSQQNIQPKKQGLNSSLSSTQPIRYERMSDQNNLETQNSEKIVEQESPEHPSMFDPQIQKKVEKASKQKKQGKSIGKESNKKVKFMIGSKLIDDAPPSSERITEPPEQEQLRIKPSQKKDEEIDQLYESISSEMKSLQGANVDDLKTKLDTIRKNKLVLEQRIKDYEKKLVR